MLQIFDCDFGERNVHIGLFDYVVWFDDRKWVFVCFEGKMFGDVLLNFEYKFEVWDFFNLVGIIIDVLRVVKIVKDCGIGGLILLVLSYFMKSLLVQYFDDQVKQVVEDFIFGKVER